MKNYFLNLFIKLLNKEEIENLFNKLGISLNTRAEELEIEKYIEIVNNI